MPSASISIPTMLPRFLCGSSPIREHRHSVHMHSYAAQPNAQSFAVCPSSQASARRKSCIAPLGMYTCTRRAALTPAHARGAARHFRTFLIPFHHINLLLQAYAAFGSCGLVVPATSPPVAPSATSAAAGNCPCGFTCARTASVTPIFVCVGKRTALRAFSVCSPEGRYLGSRRPICRFLR
jgi:hypothetical protein